MRYILVLIFSSLSLLSISKENNKNLIWDEKPEFSQILDENKDENAVGIFLEEKSEYYYSDEGELLNNHVVHKKFRVNTDDVINQFNKIYVPLADVRELLEIKARTIKPDGSIVEFDENNIKEIKDEESGNSYKIFAIDGIEKGDDIEYYIVRKMDASNFSRVYYQFKYPLQKASFSLICPKNLKYAIKGYNGFPDATYTQLDDERNQFTCKMENIPKIKEEKFSYLNPRKARVECRLDYNFNIDKSQRLTWDGAAQTVYQTMYLGVNKNHLTNWINAINVSATTNLEKAVQIENFLKSNVYIQDYHLPEFDELDYVLENKVSSERGIVKLYANLFKHWEINHQLVLTTERNSIKFDGEFQSWNYLDKYLIYLPNEDTYIDPVNVAFRMGVVNGELTATDGLFINLVKIGEFESAIGEVKYIKPLAFDANFDNMKIDIELNLEDAEARVATQRGFKGLSGGFMANFYKQLDEEQKQEMLLGVTGMNLPASAFTTLEINEKTDVNFLEDAEFKMVYDITNSSFLENAGNRILLNIGEVIGPQIEMYFEEDRTTPIENSFNRSYYREIDLKVPDGYKILNPEDADINIVQRSEQESVFGFESSHKSDGSNYRIIIDEYYKEIFVELDDFPGFKDVVNAAADFNKVVLILEKM